MIDIIQENKLNRGNLPEGWSILSLGELGIWLGGGTPNKSKSLFWTDGTVPWISPKDMKTLFIKETQDLITEAAVENSNARYIEPDAILVVTRSGILKHTLPVAINKVRATFNQDIKALVPHKDISSKFIAYFIRSSEQKILETCSKAGTTVANINFTALKEFVIPLPPLNEQRRIVAKIEELTDRTRKAREALEDVPQLIEQFRRSVLAAAFRGDLTADWREQAGIKSLGKQSILIDEYVLHEVIAPSSWRQYTFEDVCTIIGGSQPPKEHFIDEEREGYIRLIQIRDYKSDKFKTYIPKGLARRFCNKNDIMIGRYGPPIFQILRGLDGAYNVALMKAEPNLDLIVPEFLFLYLQSPLLFNYIAAASLRTAGQDGVRKQHLNKYPIFLPSIEEQNLIVQQLTSALAMLKRLEDQHSVSVSKVDQLDRAILAKAFRGQLVPQAPTDEPASQLLQRIRSEREKLKPKEKPMKKQKHP